jgi:hypothetical protein
MRLASQAQINPRASRHEANIRLRMSILTDWHNQAIKSPPRSLPTSSSNDADRIFTQPGLSAQPVDATQALNLSTGVSNPNVSRGRSLS